MSIYTIAIQSGSILLREGLEAMLIICAIATFLERMEAKNSTRHLYTGAIAAIFASFILAFIFLTFYNGMHDDRLEAIIMGVAAVLMLYVSGWMFLKQDPRRWQSEMKEAASQALAKGTLLSIPTIGFVAVLREGAETILFLQALATTSGGWSFGLLTGLIIASFMLIAMFYIIRWSVMRLPLRPVFLITSAFLFIMALKFITGMVAELQELQYLSFNDINIPSWLQDIGIGSSLESFSAQASIALIAIFGTVIASLRQRAIDAQKVAA